MEQQTAQKNEGENASKTLQRNVNLRHAALLCPLNQVYHTIPSGFWQAGGVPRCRQVPHAQWYRRAFSGYLDFSQDIPRL